MRRIPVVALCLVAVFAFSAVLAASAFAEAPEFMVCAKAQGGNGKYMNKACTEASATSEGNYERAPWTAAKKVGFKGKNVGRSKNEADDPLTTPVENKGTTECDKEKVQGEVTGPKTETWTTSYSTCSSFAAPCTTAGAKLGDVTTEELEGELIFLNAAKTEVGLKVKPKAGKGHLLAEYECEVGATVKVTGEILAGPITGDIEQASKTSTVKVEKGPLGMQSNMYPEGRHSENEGKNFFEWASNATTPDQAEYKACIEAHLKEGRTLEDAEIECGLEGKGWQSWPEEPVTLLSNLKGKFIKEHSPGEEEEVTLPSTQNSVTLDKGEAFLITGGGGGEAGSGFSVVKEQRLKGESAYTTGPLSTTRAPATVEYLITVKNAGSKSLTLEELRDAHCENPAGPSEDVLAPGSSATYACEHTITEAPSTWMNVATVKANGSQVGSNPVEARTEEPQLGSVTGTVSNETSQPIAGASVFVCGSGRCYDASTASNGSYAITGVSDDSYTASVLPPNGSPYEEAISPSFTVTGTGTTVVNVTLEEPTPPPAGTTVEGQGTVEVGGKPIPEVNPETGSPITTEACVGGIVTVKISTVSRKTGVVQTSATEALTETPLNSGKLTGSLPAIYPLHGLGKVRIKAAELLRHGTDVTDERSEPRKKNTGSKIACLLFLRSSMPTTTRDRSETPELTLKESYINPRSLRPNSAQPEHFLTCTATKPSETKPFYTFSRSSKTCRVKSWGTPGNWTPL